MRPKGGRLNITIYTYGTQPIICSIFIYLFIFTKKLFKFIYEKLGCYNKHSGTMHSKSMHNQQVHK